MKRHGLFHVRCTECGRLIPTGSRFCMYCGKEQKTETESIKVEFKPLVNISPTIQIDSREPSNQDLLSYEFKFSKLQKLILDTEPAIWDDGLFSRILKKSVVFVIVGVWEGAELFDREGAYRIRDELENRGIQVVVMTDIYWWEAVEKFGYTNPVITIGGPISNSLSKEVAKKLNLRDTAVGIAEIDGRIVGYVWGPNARKTLEGVVTFTKIYLDDFMEIIKRGGDTNVLP